MLICDNEQKKSRSWIRDDALTLNFQNIDHFRDISVLSLLARIPYLLVSRSSQACLALLGQFLQNWQATDLVHNRCLCVCAWCTIRKMRTERVLVQKGSWWTARTYAQWYAMNIPKNNICKRREMTLVQTETRETRISGILPHRLDLISDLIRGTPKTSINLCLSGIFELRNALRSGLSYTDLLGGWIYAILPE